MHFGGHVYIEFACSYKKKVIDSPGSYLGGFVGNASGREIALELRLLNGHLTLEVLMDPVHLFSRKTSNVHNSLKRVAQRPPRLA